LDAQTSVDLLRRIRHDYGNDLQVIMGYIDIGEVGQAREYIIDIVKEMVAEREIFEKTNAEAGMYLFEQLLLSRDLGVILRYDEIQMKSHETLEKKNEPLHSLKYIVDKLEAKHGDEEPVIYLEIYEKAESVDIVYSCEYLEKGSIMIEVKE